VDVVIQRTGNPDVLAVSNPATEDGQGDKSDGGALLSRRLTDIRRAAP
jgi:hypothetical protein